MITPMSHVAYSRWKLHYSIVRTDADVLSTLYGPWARVNFSFGTRGSAQYFHATRHKCRVSSTSTSQPPLGDTGRGGGRVVALASHVFSVFFFFGRCLCCFLCSIFTKRRKRLGENGETENPDEEDRKRSKQASNLLKAKKWTA
ncbi:hypothetical protein V6N12_044192 [Hibiscus sabdariffa]|uniref:Uncharacterized protein n=1 Tax=Hibiscus sabdariffa TaxID=183260 RepID=A0ABR2DGK1_9ROSI